MHEIIVQGAFNDIFRNDWKNRAPTFRVRTQGVKDKEPIVGFIFSKDLTAPAPVRLLPHQYLVPMCDKLVLFERLEVVRSYKYVLMANQLQIVIKYSDPFTQKLDLVLHEFTHVEALVGHYNAQAVERVQLVYYYKRKFVSS